MAKKKEPPDEKPKVEKEPEVKDDPRLPNKSLFRIDEVAKYFGITERCVYLWIEHGHLIKENIQGIARVPRESILRCRIGKIQTFS